MKLRLHCHIFLLLLILAFGMSPGIMAEEVVDCGAKLLAVTFDDGPGADTPRLLDALKDNDAHVTFFVLGNLAQNRAEIVKRAYDEGHQIASHSWNHSQLTKLSVEALQQDLGQTASVIRGITGQQEVYLRPPYGSYNDTVRTYAGGPIIFWSVDTLDWKYRDVETVKQTILNQAADGAIILLHDIHPTSVDGFIAALGELKSQGYELVTVSELLRRRGVAVGHGTVYISAPNQGINLPPLDYDGEEYDESKLDQHWAYDAICFVKERGLLQGLSENEFGPEKYMRRGMFVAILSRLSGDVVPEKSSSFTDVPEDEYYASSVAWAEEHQIISSGDDEFHPEDFVTREEICVMLDRYSAYQGEFPKQFQAASENISAFADAGEISDWAKASVESLTQSGVIHGTDGGFFDPQAKATRAEVSVILQNYCEQYGGKGVSLWAPFFQRFLG
ncbi:MAG: polysaccharide deacetylase family protein [Bacillota bacterium]|nr:polysaccharide deacetylase family protein [Bacillota bacterium]